MCCFSNSDGYVIRSCNHSAVKQGYSKYAATKARMMWIYHFHCQDHLLNTPLSLLSYAEYVNAQELATDMRSITDRAAPTLLWTELFTGGDIFRS